MLYIIIIVIIIITIIITIIIIFWKKSDRTLQMELSGKGMARRLMKRLPRRLIVRMLSDTV